jgi:sortase A
MTVDDDAGTTVSDQPGAGRAARRGARRAAPSPLSTGRRAVRTAGEILITLGAVLLLFSVYQLFWTNVSADLATQQVTDQIRSEWQYYHHPTGGTSGATTVPAFNPGQGFALLHIPRLGHGWVRPIVQGVTLDDLKKGVGHYPQTAAPGQIGNFAVAGHRATNGQPFASLDLLRPGDPVVVETESTWYVYRVDRTRIVAPTHVSVLLPVPDEPGVKPTKAIITLTTCNPRWASYQRMIVTGTLVETRPKSEGPPAVLGSGG